VRSSKRRWRWAQCRPLSAAPTFGRVVLAGCFHSGLTCGLPPARASTARRSAEWAGVASGSRRTWPKMESCSDKSGLLSLLCQFGYWLRRSWQNGTNRFLRSVVGNSCGMLLIAVHQPSGESMSQSHITVWRWQGHCKAVSSSVNSILSASRCWRVCRKYLKLDQYAWVSVGWNAQTSGYHCQDMWSGLWTLWRQMVVGATKFSLSRD